MLSKFKAYQLALELFRECEKIKCHRHLKDQLIKASSSISLNLAEGSAKPTPNDRKKFYFIALGSLRETQTIIEMIDFPKKADLQTMADNLGGQIYNLCRSLQRQGKKPTAHWP